MLINEIGGVNIKDDTFATPPTVKELYRAGGAIGVGLATVMDTVAAATTNVGSQVIVAPVSTAAATDWAMSQRFTGIYTGVGGTGTETAVSGLSGKAAVAGDMILVVQKGMVSAVADATVTTITAVKHGSSTAGRVMDSAFIASTGIPTIGVSLEGATVGVAFRIVLK